MLIIDTRHLSVMLPSNTNGESQKEGTMNTQLNEVVVSEVNKLAAVEGLASQNTVEAAVKAYRAIKLQIEALELELKEHKSTIEAECYAHADFKFTCGLFKCSLSEVSRENFKLKEAKPVLGDLLTPFLSTTKYTMLKVS